MDLPRIKRVKQSWALVEKDLQGAGVLFFSNIFRGNPELLDLFSFRDFKGELHRSPAFLRHSLGVMRAVGLVVASLEDVESVIPVLKSLGNSHKEFGVLEGMYGTIGGHLIQTLKSALGASWTPEVEEAWITAYGTVSAVMKNPDDITVFSMRPWDYTVLVAALGWAWISLYHLAGFRGLGGVLDGPWVRGIDLAFGMVFLCDLLAPHIHVAFSRSSERRAAKTAAVSARGTQQAPVERQNSTGATSLTGTTFHPFARPIMVPLRKLRFKFSRWIMRLHLDTLEREPWSSWLCILSFPLVNIDRLWVLMRTTLRAVSRWQMTSGLTVMADGLLGSASHEVYASSACAVGGPRFHALACASDVLFGGRYPSGDASGMEALSLFVLLRLATLPRALRLSNSLKNSILVKTNYWTGAALRLAQLMVMMVFVVHAFGCWWFIVTRLEGATRADAWTVNSEQLQAPSGYILAVHRGFVEASGIGNSESPDTGLQALSSLVMHIVGAALFTMIVGNTVTFMESSTRIEDTVSLDVHQLKEFMTAAGMPDHAKRPLVDGLVSRAVLSGVKEKDRKGISDAVGEIAKDSEMLWSSSNVDTTLMSQLPECVSKLPQYMQADILLHLRIRAMRMLHTFKKLSEPALNIAARSMDTKIILHAGDFLYRQGESMPNLVFYIQSGELELTTDNQTLVTVRAGTVIGEEVIAHVLSQAQMGRRAPFETLYAGHSVRAISTAEILGGCGANTLCDLWEVHEKDARHLQAAATRKKNLLSSLSNRALSFKGSSVEWRMNWNAEVSKTLDKDDTRSISSGSSSGTSRATPSGSVSRPPAPPSGAGASRGLGKANTFTNR